MRNPLFPESDKAFLLGNEALAAAALDSHVGMVTCYPGTPSSEVMDTFANLDFSDSAPLHLEYSVNEKVALEVGIGAALAGVPALVAMKHVGLNVAADPLFTAAYIGPAGGLVILSADDPGCHSSQNEQDNRGYARFAHLPCFEPAGVQEMYDFARAAFRISRELEQPALLRCTTRVCHGKGLVRRNPAQKFVPKTFMRQPGRFVPVPATAIRRHPALLAQMENAKKISELGEFNKIHNLKNYTENNRAEYGVIASGMARAYLADAMYDGQFDLPALELGMTWPLPENLIGKFLRSCQNALVLEEGEPFLEKEIRALAQKCGCDVRISGQRSSGDSCGELSTSEVARRLRHFMGLEAGEPQKASALQKLPGRPPNLCPGCAHRSVYYAVRECFGDDAIYASDIGCYTLGLLPPFKCADFAVCMGSSATGGSGFARASGKLVIGFIGDSTFFHSGITGLLNAVYNRHNILLIVLDNSTTAMTGHQPNPGMHQQSLGERSKRIDMEAVIRGLGVEDVLKVNAHKIGELQKALADLAAGEGVRVLIAEEPCILYARKKLRKNRRIVASVARQGEAVEKCARDLACPAFYRRENELLVNENLCAGCMVCAQIAPGHIRAKAL